MDESSVDQLTTRISALVSELDRVKAVVSSNPGEQAHVASIVEG
ncbi:hypothetical protein V6N13_093374 [Hibiscus sabdariffa]